MGGCVVHRNLSALTRGITARQGRGQRASGATRHGMIDSMLALTTPGASAESYAPPARRRGYIRAMRQLAQAREPQAPIRVYVSAPPQIKQRPNWENRLKTIQDALPGVELLYYDTVFRDLDHYLDEKEGWATFATGLDGLVVLGRRKKPSSISRKLRIGPIARNELRTVVPLGKPVLLHTMEYGLVPIVDCLPERFRWSEGEEGLKLTIPDGWDSASPTLAAALGALCPASAPESNSAQPS